MTVDIEEQLDNIMKVAYKLERTADYHYGYDTGLTKEAVIMCKLASVLVESVHKIREQLHEDLRNQFNETMSNIGSVLTTLTKEDIAKRAHNTYNELKQNAAEEPDELYSGYMKNKGE